MAVIPVARMLFKMVSVWRKWCLSKLRFNARNVKIACCVLLCALIPYNIMFYTRGCRHTHSIFNTERPDAFRHGHPPRLPTHFLPGTPFSPEAGGAAVELLAAPVAPIVHFVWCSDGFFQYQHYLSVLSAFKFLKPTAVFFHYLQEPELDADGYYQFFKDLKRDLPNLVLRPLRSSSACSSSLDVRFQFVLNLLNADGGVFVGDSTVLADSLAEFRKRSISLAASEDRLEVVMMERGFLDSRASVPDLAEISAVQDEKGVKFSCGKTHAVYKVSPSTPCVTVSSQIFPVNVWELDSDFGRLARWVSHGKAKILRPRPANSTVIPKVVHYVWLGSNHFKYFSYLSLLSALYVLNVDMVYVHGDIQPQGRYWQKMKRHKRVTFVNRDVPGAIFAEPIVKFLSHASDYWRGDLLIRYGGVYMDWDVIWVNPIPEDLRRYDTVACADFPATGAFPDVFNMGVLLAAPGSQYLRYFLESYHHYLDGHWSYNAIHMPYKVYEKHPDLLLVNRHLQVICAKGLCHPVWHPKFKDRSIHHLNQAPFDWKTDTLAMHWTYPDPEEFADEQTLSESITMFAAIGKYVLKKAEPYLEKELV